MRCLTFPESCRGRKHTIYMLAPLSNPLRAIGRFAFGSTFRRVLTIPLLFAAAYFLVAFFTYYRGTYDAPETVDLQFEEIITPVSAYTIFTEQPEVRTGLLVIDGAHVNDFLQGQVVSLRSSMANRGISVEFMGQPSSSGGFRRVSSSDRVTMLETKLRQAGSLVVIAPRSPYTQDDTWLVRRFVQKLGRSLLIGLPPRCTL